MSLPELLAGTVGDEEVVTEVPLGGDDRLVVTPTRTLVYRGDGLLSDESVAEYSHDVEHIAVSTGRRKAKITLGYGLDGDETLSVPAGRVDDVLHPILAGVLSASGVTDPGESVLRTFRFSELTLVVTSDRLVKHVGSAVWDPEFEEFPYADLTGLDFEEGTVATAVVLAHDGRSERFKAPNESARAVRETLADAVCAYHDVESLEEFRVAAAAETDEPEADDRDDASGTTDFGEGPDPLSASPVADAEAEAEAGADDTPASVAGSATDGPAATPADSTAATAVEASDSVESDAGPESASDPDATAVSADAAATPSEPTEPRSTESDSTTDPLEADPLSEDFLTDDPLVDDSGDERPPATDSAAADTAAAADAPAERDVAAGVRSDDVFDGSPFESAGVEDADLATEVAALRSTVEAQSDRLDRQSALIEQLIEELRRGR